MHLYELGVNSIGILESCDLCLTLKGRSLLLIDCTKTGKVESRWFLDICKILVIELDGALIVLLSGIGIGKVLTGNVQLLLVVLILLSSILEHLDSLVILLGILQGSTIIGIVETGNLCTVRCREESLSILQGLLCLVHVSEVIESQTVPCSLAGVASQTILCHLKTLVTLLKHPSTSSIVGDVYILKLRLVGNIIIAIYTLLQKVG